MNDWHLCHWRQAKMFLTLVCRFPPVIANYTLPPLDYLWPCAYDDYVPPPHNPDNPVFIPPANDEGEDWI